MSLAQIGALRDKYYQALLDMPDVQHDNSVDGESHSLDTHRANLQKQFEYYNNLYNNKSGAGATRRLNQKAL